MRPIWLILFAALVSGCASKTTQQVNKTSYQIGAESVAVLGVPFLTSERGAVIHGKQWEGIAFGGMHHSYTKSDDYRLVELFYGGFDGQSAVVVSQSTSGNASTPDRRTYSLDLGSTNTFQIDRFSIEVLSATSGSMKFRVVGD